MGYPHDGECDTSPGGLLEPSCPPGTDWLDCDPCSSKDDGKCDTVTDDTRLEEILGPGFPCPRGTDFIDCEKQKVAECHWDRQCESYLNEIDCERQGHRGC